MAESNSTGDDKSVGFEAAKKIILRWDSTVSEEAREKMIFESDRQEADLYLQAVDEIQRSLSKASLSDDRSKASTIQIAMARLEDEFRNILITYTAALETESVTDRTSSASIHSHLSSTSSNFESEEEFILNTEKLLELEHCESSDSPGADPPVAFVRCI
ncbi:hypothetical protein SLA2020_100020 [Shorea laevis]